ncbi:MAG: hypothetical protein IJG37_05980 [Synergistaceae bacterium]|nr:hypothetical protein [Synergistaceae bacterium]MBQ6971030.1 hypothetical protein [Synergistaceae bacterium]
MAQSLDALSCWDLWGIFYSMAGFRARNEGLHPPDFGHNFLMSRPSFGEEAALLAGDFYTPRDLW